MKHKIDVAVATAVARIVKLRVPNAQMIGEMQNVLDMLANLDIVKTADAVTLTDEYIKCGMQIRQLPDEISLDHDVQQMLTYRQDDFVRVPKII